MLTECPVCKKLINVDEFDLHSIYKCDVCHILIRFDGAYFTIIGD
jgi:hypothetical protein